ncbi:TadE family type IV pilus minor pilin [Mycetocola saprophilus]|uniref:TadE family type IV pilus minor pilin n=1 Tax=Mycetocola saprophilus TaxID=76636 RepID=UPI003BF5C5D1
MRLNPAPSNPAIRDRDDRRPRTRRMLRGEEGSISAEFAIVMPAVLVLLALCLGVLAAGTTRSRLWDVAGQSARASARGDPEQSIMAQARELLPGVAVKVDSQASLVCATADIPIGGVVGRMLPLRLEARVCTLPED